jgi:hypothetical protein
MPRGSGFLALLAAVLVSCDTAPTGHGSASFMVATTPSPSHAGSTSGDGRHLSGSTVTVAATAADGYRFLHWSESSQIAFMESQYTFTVTRDRTLIANFTAEYRVHVSGSGTGDGRIISSPAGIDCASSAGATSGTCSASYPDGLAVTLNAVPATDHTFIGWSGDCTGTTDCSVVMSEDRNVVAAFEEPPPSYTLVVRGAGDGDGSVRSDPEGLDCQISAGSASGTCSAPFSAGTHVALEAVSATGHSLHGWSGGCSGSEECQVTMTADREVTASFTVESLTWTARNVGLSVLDINSLAVNDAGHIFACTHYGDGVYRSTDNGDGWLRVSSGLPEGLRVSWNIAISNSGTIYLSGSTGAGLYKSVNNGSSWTHIYPGERMRPRVIVFNAQGQMFAGMAAEQMLDGGIYRSDNGGHAWHSLNQIIDVNAMKIDSSGDIYAGTYQTGLYRSTDNGSNFHQLGSNLLRVTDIDINSNGDIFVATGNGVFRSTDNGGNWTAVNAGLSNLNVYALVIGPNDVLFVATWGGGVFRSSDNGASWTAVNYGLTELRVWTLTINSDGELFAGTPGGGVFRSSPTLNRQARRPVHPPPAGPEQ